MVSGEVVCDKWIGWCRLVVAGKMAPERGRVIWELKRQAKWYRTALLAMGQCKTK
jgi:hypothetical protein